VLEVEALPLEDFFGASFGVDTELAFLALALDFPLCWTIGRETSKEKQNDFKIEFCLHEQTKTKSTSHNPIHNLIAIASFLFPFISLTVEHAIPMPWLWI
jgi:hypothetical protein